MSSSKAAAGSPLQLERLREPPFQETTQLGCCPKLRTRTGVRQADRLHAVLDLSHCRAKAPIEGISYFFTSQELKHSHGGCAYKRAAVFSYQFAGKPHGKYGVGAPPLTKSLKIV